MDRKNMNIKNLNVILLYLLFFLLSITVVGLILLTFQVTKLDVSLLFNKLFDFALSLVSFLIAFSLGQVYWDWKLKKEKSDLLRQTAQTYLEKIHSLAYKASLLLEPLDSSYLTNIKENNIKVNVLLDEIENTCKIFISIFEQLPLVEDTILIKQYYEKMQPTISRLSIVKLSHENKIKISALREVMYAADEIRILATSMEEK